MAPGMTAAALGNRIQEELASLGGRPPHTLHGIDLPRCLVPPFQCTLDSPAPDAGPVEAWVVLDECPGAAEG